MVYDFSRFAQNNHSCSEVERTTPTDGQYELYKLLSISSSEDQHQQIAIVQQKPCLLAIVFLFLEETFNETHPYTKQLHDIRMICTDKLFINARVLSHSND